MIALFCALFFTYAIVYGQYASKFPAPIPLFHKSPYFNAWLPTNDSIYSQGDYALVMPGKYFLDWMIAVRVDSTAYLLQGEANVLQDAFQSKYVAARTIGAYITSTRTVLTMNAGPVRVNITYLTPVELNNWALHSLPFVYFAIDLWSTDGNAHTIQVYSDVGGTFLSADRENKMTWNTTITSKSIYHQAQQSIIRTLTETYGMSEDGTQYFATGVCSADEMSRRNFSSIGRLANTSDTKFRTIRNGWTRMGFALDFGRTTQISKPSVFALGLVRDPVLKYAKDGTQSRSALWWTKWSNVGQAIDAFLSDFPSALFRAIELDNKIVSDTSVISSEINLPPAVAGNLTDLTVLSLRQTIGSLEFTTVRLPDGHFAGMDHWRVFMKDFGSTRRVSPVDNLYAAFPAFLYLDTFLAGKLLEPLLEFQASPMSTDMYAAPDLGDNWPLVIGNNKDQFYLGVESCGSMLVMVLTHAKKSGDGGLIATYYDLLRKWADFLVANSLEVNEYTTSADSLINTTSNLALKGIMGIYAMAQISRALERDSIESMYYLNIAKNYVQQWQSRVLSSDHVMTQYGNTTSWGLLFNLYAPRLLGADIIPQTIYETQASWYSSQIIKAVASNFGIPLDSSMPGLIKAPWTLLTAASVFNSSARDALISMVHSRSFLVSAAPALVQLDANPSVYFMDSRNPTGLANPAMGASFAFLALSVPDIVITLPSPSTSRLPAILGGVLGGVTGLIIILTFVYFLLRRRKPREDVMDEPHPFTDEVRPTGAEVMDGVDSPEVIPAVGPPSDAPPSYASHTMLSGEVRLIPHRPLANNVQNEGTSRIMHPFAE